MWYYAAMKKILSALALLLSLFPLSAAWNIGGEAGYALNFIETATIWPETEYRPGHGASLSFAAEYDFGNGFSLATGLRYAEKSFGYYHGNGGNPVSDYMEMNHFLELPLTARYTYDVGNVGLFIGGGGYIGIWFLSQWFGSSENASETEHGPDIAISSGDIIPLGGSDNLFEAGLIAEAGVSWTVRRDIRLDFTLRYEASLTSLVRNTQRDTVHRYNDTLLFTVGCLVPIGGDV